MPSSSWKEITPSALIGAVKHIRERFEETEFKFDFFTQQKCYKELHPVAPPTTPSTVFNDYLSIYEEGLRNEISREFDDLLEIGLAHAGRLRQHPIEWAQQQLELLIDGKPERVRFWVKNVCDQQPISQTTSPEDTDEFVHWHSWRAPKFIVMQPSGNVAYNPADAWQREDGEQTQKFLNALSKRFFHALVFHLEKVAGEAHVRLAKKAVHIDQPDFEESPNANSAHSEPDASEKSAPLAFISYSWDSDVHKQWVLELAARLQSEGGVRIILDRWHLPPGRDKAVFMEKSVSNSKFVVLICTPKYATRANNREGGVGYEATIITGQLAENINQVKFIPVLRDGAWESSLPVWIKTKVGVDLRNNPYSDEQYQNLLRALHSALLPAPPIGPKPTFGSRPSSNPEIEPPEWALRAATENDLTSYQREAIRRKLSVDRINGLHPGLTVWLTNRSDRRIFVKSVSLWHGNSDRNHRKLAYAVPSENRKFVEVGGHKENMPIGFDTDDDAMLRLQSLGVVDRRLALHQFVDDVDIEVRVEYELLGVDDEYRESVRVRVQGNRQIETV